MASIYRPTYRTKDGAKKTSRNWHGRAYINGRGFTRSLDTTSRSVAKERLNEWVSDLRSRGWKEHKSRLFEDACIRFIDDHFPRIKVSSAKRYGVSISQLRPYLEGLTLDKIGSAELSYYETERRRAGVSDGTIRRDITCLAAIYRCAEEWEWHSGNPAAAYLRAAQRRGLTEAPPRTRYLSHEEEETILQAIQERIATASTPKRKHAAQMLYAAVAISIDTGLRREELFGLPRIDIDLGGKELTVRAERAKSSIQRSVPILERSLEIIKRLPVASEYLLYPHGGVRYADLPQQFERLVKKLGMTGLRWHDLRRTCGCRLIQDYQMDLKRVSVWLGHSSVEQTERAYAFLDHRHLHRHLKELPAAKLLTVE